MKNTSNPGNVPLEIYTPKYCVVCKRKRPDRSQSRRNWAIIKTPDPRPGEPVEIVLCPRHKNAVREQILEDRKGNLDVDEKDYRTRVDDLERNKIN